MPNIAKQISQNISNARTHVRTHARSCHIALSVFCETGRFLQVRTVRMATTTTATTDDNNDDDDPLSIIDAGTTTAIACNMQSQHLVGHM